MVPVLSKMVARGCRRPVAVFSSRPTEGPS